MNLTNFLKKGLIISLLTILPYILIQYSICLKTDPYYWKSIKKSNSLIIGLSLARTGIMPNILKKELKLDMIPQNIALSSTHSPFGPLYFAFIKRKLFNTSKKGIHIISVNPESIMNLATEKEFSREKETLLYQLYSLNYPINVEYILRRYSSEASYLYLGLTTFFGMTKTKSTKNIYHKDGWTETIVLNEQKLTSGNINNLLVPNKQREIYFERTIDFLAKSGKIIVVRLPVEPTEKKRIEQLYPTFDSYLKEVTQKRGFIFLDFSNDYQDYQFFDKPGYHLESNSAKRFSRRLAQSINTHLDL